MKIYEAEIKAGLEEKIKSSASIAYLCQATSKNIQASDADLQKFAAKANANPNQFDLYYLDSILVSTGWNLNDDVFDAQQTWAARTSPIDKQFNFMHNEKDIIGHITSASIIVNDEIYNGEDIPESDFHITVGSVLYKSWSDADLKERMDTLISEIEEGKWYVSMECLFSDFDYALLSDDGKASVVKRNKTTAYLSKHLRAYGGHGAYDGYKIGRLLKNIVFSGKGLVNEPANPNSIIFNGQDVKTLTKSFRAYTTVATKQWEKTMNPEEVLKAQAEKLTKELEELKAEKKNLETEIRAKAEKENLEKVENLNKSVSELAEQVKAGEVALSEKDKLIADANKKIEEAQAKLDELNKENQSLKASIKKSQRVTELTKAGVSVDKHEELLNKFDNVSDDIFAEFVALYAAKKDEKEKVDNKEEEMKEGEDKSKAAVKEAEEALESAKADKVAPVSAPVETDTTKDIRAKASAWLANTFKATASRNIRKVSQETANVK